MASSWVCTVFYPNGNLAGIPKYSREKPIKTDKYGKLASGNIRKPDKTTSFVTLNDVRYTKSDVIRKEKGYTFGCSKKTCNRQKCIWCLYCSYVWFSVQYIWGAQTMKRFLLVDWSYCSLVFPYGRLLTTALKMYTLSTSDLTKCSNRYIQFILKEELCIRKEINVVLNEVICKILFSNVVIFSNELINHLICKDPLKVVKCQDCKIFYHIQHLANHKRKYSGEMLLNAMNVAKLFVKVPI